MSSTIAGEATLPKPPARTRAVMIMAGVGILTGLISSLPSPLPDLRLEDPEILINADGVPLHAGIAFGAGLAAMLWLWASRDLGKCLLAMALTVMGWLAAVNTANDVMSAIVSSDLFGTAEGAKANREVVGWVLAGLVGGAIGAGLTAFGAGFAATRRQAPRSLEPHRRDRCTVWAPPLSSRPLERHGAPLCALAGCGRRFDRPCADPSNGVSLKRVHA